MPLVSDCTAESTKILAMSSDVAVDGVAEFSKVSAGRQAL